MSILKRILNASPATSDGGTQLVHSTLIEEYRTRMQEIIANLNSARQITTITFTAIGVLIAATPYVTQSHAWILYLVAALFFCGLALTQVRYIYLAQDMNTYLSNTVIPQIRQALARSSSRDSSEFLAIMSWHLPGKSPILLRSGRLARILFVPIAGAGYGIPLLAAAAAIGAFLLVARPHSGGFTEGELVFLFGDGLVLIYSVLWGFQADLRR